MRNDEDSNLEKALVSLAIEKVLLSMGKPEFELVICSLEKEYDCYLTDCCEKPEYLKLVLKDIFGNSAINIINSIDLELQKSSNKEKISEFMKILRS